MRLQVGRTLAACAAVVVSSLPMMAWAQGWPKAAPPHALAARHVDLPPYEIRTFSNGLQVIVVPHDEEPAVTFRLLVGAGALEEPADRPGVASLVAALLNQGTTTRSAEEIAMTIDAAGGVIGVGSANDATYLGGAVLKDRIDVALGLVSDMVEHPAFAANEIALQRRQMLSSLQVAYDEPGYIAGLVFNRLIFGLHPYGRPNEGTPASIARISADDLVRFHRTWFVPNNACLAIVGDLAAGEGFAAADRAFGTWARREVPAVAPAEPPPPARRVLVIDRPGSAQTEIRVGQLAIPRAHPDRLALDLAIRILGGEGANRLFGTLRSERGLAYGASASLDTFKTGGDIVAETSTRSSATGESLRLIVDAFARLQRVAVGSAELEGAQHFIAGHLPLSIEAPSALADEILAHVFHGQDVSEIETYPDRAARVTPADVQRVSRQWLSPDRLSIVLVGDASAFVDQLRSMGFAEFDRIPLADLDLDVPTLRSTAGVAPAAQGGR